MENSWGSFTHPSSLSVCLSVRTRGTLASPGEPGARSLRP